MLTNVLTPSVAPQPQLGVLFAEAGQPPLFSRKFDADREESVECLGATVEVAPAALVKRRTAHWGGMAAEIVQATSAAPIEFSFKAPVHLLVLVEQGTRRDGETCVGDLRSSLRDAARKLIFVPAGQDYRDRYEPRTPTRMVFFYIDPETMPASAASGEAALAPRIFFEDATVLATAQKLAQSVESLDSDNRPYLEALGLVLKHELTRFFQGGAPSKPMLRGGLAAWQQRTVTNYVEEHLPEAISLADLAGLVGLSTFHFCRAFKQSFGVPPHRYHTRRRIERAKELLALGNPSVTEIGLELGFSETSSFTAAFRKIAGLTPTAYRRSLA